MAPTRLRNLLKGIDLISVRTKNSTSDSLGMARSGVFAWQSATVVRMISTSTSSFAVEIVERTLRPKPTAAAPTPRIVATLLLEAAAAVPVMPATAALVEAPAPPAQAAIGLAVVLFPVELATPNARWNSIKGGQQGSTGMSRFLLNPSLDAFFGTVFVDFAKLVNDGSGQNAPET